MWCPAQPSVSDGQQLRLQHKATTYIIMSLGKLSRIGGEWCLNLSLVPDGFSLECIKEYLIYSNDKTFGHQSVRAYKSLCAWSFSHGGHVIMMHMNIIPTSNIFMVVRAYCLPSQSTTHVYSVHICFDKRVGMVYGAECRCVAGLSDSCSHALFPLDDLLSQGKSCIPEDMSCTDAPCSWIAPANSAKVQPVPFHNVLMHQLMLGKKKPAANEMTLQDFHPIQLANIKASPMAVGELEADFRYRSPTCQFLTMFSAQMYVETTNSTSLPSLPESLPYVSCFCDMAPSTEMCINTTDGAVTGFSAPGEAATQGFLDMRRLVQATGSLVAQTFLADLEPSPQHARQVEQDTRDQSINNQWYYHRVGRISSSRSRQIGRTRDATDLSLILYLDVPNALHQHLPLHTLCNLQQWPMD